MRAHRLLAIALLTAGTPFRETGFSKCIAEEQAPDLHAFKWDDYVPDDPVETAKFRAKVVPLIHDYIFLNWDKYRSSEFTFRDLKQFLAKELKVTYEKLKQDKYSIVIEDTVDEITNKCDAGNTPVRTCRRKLAKLGAGYEHLKDET